MSAFHHKDLDYNSAPNKRKEKKFDFSSGISENDNVYLTHSILLYPGEHRDKRLHDMIRANTYIYLLMSHKYTISD